MHNMDWDQVRFFLAVVRNGSVSNAAKILKVNQSTVSRRITALEDQLGRPLFDRTANGWLVTPVGERLVKPAERMADEAHAIERQVVADSQELSGLLRVTVAEICTQVLAMPAISQFIRQYPSINLEVISSNAELDLAARDADVAVRVTEDPPQDLVGKRIGLLAYAVYGVEAMYERVMEGDQTVPCITWIGDGHSKPEWVTKSFTKTPYIYRCSGLAFMQRMVQEGLGVAQMPCALGDSDPLLRRIPVRYVEAGWGLWVLSHVDLRTTARVRLFRDYLVSELEQKLDLIEGRMPSH